MAGLFSAVATDDPQYISGSEENAERAEKAANGADSSADEAAANAAAAKDYMLKAAGAVTGVGLFNERFGAVYPKTGDYTAAMVGARSDSWVPDWSQVTNKPAILNATEAQNITGLITFNGVVSSSVNGFQFGPSRGFIGYNSLSSDIQFGYADTGAKVGLQADGILYTTLPGSSVKQRYYTEAKPFPISTNYKLLTVSAADTVSIDPKSASVFNITLTQQTTNIVLQLYTETEDSARQLTMFIAQGNGSQTVNWDSKIKWSQGRIPTLSLTKGHNDIVTLISLDRGASWFGMFNGGWF